MLEAPRRIGFGNAWWGDSAVSVLVQLNKCDRRAWHEKGLVVGMYLVSPHEFHRVIIIPSSASTRPGMFDEEDLVPTNDLPYP